MPDCLFSDNIANSREHLWPDWVHKKKDFGPLKSTRDSQDIIIPDPEITVRVVCKHCNNGWMSDLEVAAKPVIGCMFDDVSLNLDRNQQKLVAAWCMKTAIITDATRSRTKSIRFYTEDECADMRRGLTIPPKTRIWIGRIETSHLASSGTDYERLTADGTRISIDSVVTLIVGHFVTQVITTHLLPEFANQEIPDGEPKGGDWSNDLVQIWPIQKEWVTWPPRDSFTNGGRYGVGYLMDRWRIGKRVNQVLPAPSI